VKDLNNKKLKLREIAEVLNSNGFASSKGKKFSTTKVLRIKNKISQIA